MKKLLLSLVAFATFSINTLAQSPEGFNYQAVIRNASNEIVANQAVGLRMTLQQGSIGGTTVYSETFLVTTTTNGLVNVQIGSGSVLSGIFTTIDWANGPFFIETAVDATGGSNYVVMGTSQLMSVPYASYAKNGITSAQADAITAQANAITALQAQINTINAVLPQSAYASGSVFCASGPALVVNVTNPITGKIWMDRNLGATQVATSSTDAHGYGDLYQWGRRSDGHQCRTSASIEIQSSIDQPAHGDYIMTFNFPLDWRSPQNENLWQGVNGVNNPCPSGYRIPTETELESERSSWGANSSTGAFTSPLKLPLAGVRVIMGGNLGGADEIAGYWSSTVSFDNSIYLDFNSSSASIGSWGRARGFSVRCIKN